MLTIFHHHIVKNNLEHKLKIIHVAQLPQLHFDQVISIDAPEVLPLYERITVECHTSYVENMRYLNHLPANVEQVLVPSPPFAQSLLEHYSLDANKVAVLPNFVLPKSSVSLAERIWNKRILFYYGRLDYRKNPHELLKIMHLVSRLSDDFLFYILSPSHAELRQLFSAYRGLREKIILGPGLPFAQVDEFLRLMKRHEGIYLSASKSESFGLTNAEAMAHGIPIVVTDNEVNRYLTQETAEYLYTLGNHEEAAEKILYLAEHYEDNIPCNQFLTEELPRQHLNKINSILATVSKSSDRESCFERVNKQRTGYVEVGYENSNVE